MREGVRLQKHLARAGVASRRAAESIIVAGRVRVNGVVVRELGTRIDPELDRVEVDGRAVAVPPVEWIVLNKPRGHVCTRSDPQGRRTVYDLLPKGLHTLFTVGRLDADTEGLLLLTNDGDTANRLLHPRFEVERDYVADVAGPVPPDTVARLRNGVVLEDGPARARTVSIEESGRTARIALTLTEGRKREVRRMLAAVGHPAVALKRIRYGGIELGDIGTGEWRKLSAAEVALLDAAAGERVDGPAADGRRTEKNGQA
jgi:23S rRNA pseudouridine2605 synthase